ncbi:MAG: LacI family DNA-binding transcriptional regulator [Salana multivorans]|uniref:LacI family DNA-binding transcriptional regulator n=1 Tax=Salana multivorans TaxID=120377 RepID=UPI000A8468C5|nr:LacI family DNA-binding transcriptional regulator [Salana multivorans]MBN8883510.1 LacI family DNA-binding transcriptional regulator [Salana multivorans]
MPHYDPEGTTTKEWDIGTEGSPRRATIRDVAAHAGVSRSAVSKVFNAKGGISPATEARIRESARALNWAPSASAAALASDSTRTVGLVIRRGPDLLFADPHFALLIGGVEEILVPAGYGLQLHLIGEDRELERGLYTRLATQRRVDGVLLTESELGDPRHALLDELGLPSVMLGWPDPEEEQRWNVVSAHPSEHRTAYHEAARHLTDLGHRRVAYVSGPERLVHTGYRRREFERELTRNGAELVTRVHLDFSVEQVVEACLSMVDGPRPPTAFAFANDSMALAAIGALSARGIRVPQDISIIGHDNLPTGQWSHPGLTTIAQDLRGMARQAAILLLRQLGDTSLSDEPMSPPRLVIRGTTGPASS